MCFLDLSKSASNHLLEFVDMMWRQGSELFGLQVTLSDTHPKAFNAFKNTWLKDKLDVNLAGNSDESQRPTRITIIYVLQPNIANEQRTSTVSSGFACSSFNSTVANLQDEWREIVETNCSKRCGVRFLIAKPDHQAKEAWEGRGNFFDNECPIAVPSTTSSQEPTAGEPHQPAQYTV